MDTIKPLFTATATATGGRNGHTEAADGSVRADLSVPKGSRSSFGSKTQACLNPIWRRLPRKPMKKSALIRTPRAARST
jgi:hypothetical protein